MIYFTDKRNTMTPEERSALDAWLQADPMPCTPPEEDAPLYADGFEDAAIGIAERCGQPPLVVYSRTRCVDILMTNGMTEAEAVEYLEYNLVGAWAGEGTPLVMHEMSFSEIQEFFNGWL